MIFFICTTGVRHHKKGADQQASRAEAKAQDRSFKK